MTEPFTPEELAEAATPQGIAYLEDVADQLEKRSTLSVDQDSSEGQAILKRHGIQ